MDRDHDPSRWDEGRAASDRPLTATGIVRSRSTNDSHGDIRAVDLRLAAATTMTSLRAGDRGPLHC
jgi:hypothetical protein